MNERIKELIKEMGIIPEDEHYEVAEAVVRKCADLCSDLDGGENMFSRGIRKHFGVE